MVGTYAEKGGRGLQELRRSRDSLSVGAAEPRIANASFGAWSARTRTAYFVDEQETGRVTAWQRRGGTWHEHGAHGTGGALPCFVSHHAGTSRLAVANYADGTLALFELEAETGMISGMAEVRRASGRGPHPDRQTGPHAHCVLFGDDGASLFHVDLGLDRVFRYSIGQGRLGQAEVAFAAPAGTGPRHLLFLGRANRAALLCELSAELMLLERRSRGFVLRHSVALAPEPSSGNLGGHLALAPDGRILVSNRGHDSLAAFEWRYDRLIPSGWVRTGGASPRHFLACGEDVLVAHEESGDVTLVPLPQPGDAGLPPRAHVELAGAAFLFATED